ncbi:glycosyltransferase [Halobacteriovorax sp. ZH5_bin.2]|uniref:glycosyltransferase n=1 Tax=Halobacteriovorax sp. ZH5_bin.2 TaxID=3157727 RepID=UPI0037128183
MKNNIWFVTRSYPPTKGGGPFVRKQQVEFLISKGYKVTVLTQPQAAEIDDTNVVIIDHMVSSRLLRYMERLCLLFDYLFLWSKKVADYIINNAQEGDVIFITSGGELGFLQKVQYLKKYRPDLKVVMNYHDLLIYSRYQGQKSFSHPHLPIDFIERKNISHVDYVITQSNRMSEILSEKFPMLKNKISSMYFGIPEIYEQKKSPSKELIKLVYIGTMGKLQSPEVILDALKSLPGKIRKKLNITFIGDFKQNSRIKNSNLVEKISYIPREELINRCANEYDYAIVTAQNIRPLETLMPTKFYEYLGIGIPVLSIVAENCEISNVIEKYNFGVSVVHGNKEQLVNELINIVEKYDVSNFRKCVIENRNLLSSNKTLELMCDVIENKLN